MVSDTTTAEQRVLDAGEPDPADSAAAAFACPISLLSEVSLPHLSPHVCVVSQVHCERDSRPALPASGFFMIREPKTGLFSSLF